MNFLAREHVFMMLGFLSLGVFGDVTEPNIQNKVVVTGTINATISCFSTQNAKTIRWSKWIVGDRKRLVLVDHVHFDRFIDAKGSHLIITIADESTAGIYICNDDTDHSAQFVVISEEPTCKYTANEKTPCDKISEMSCTVRYAANDSYVVANMTWSSVDSSSSFNSLIDTSTSGNIITAVSTLKLAKPENKESLSKFRCATSFSLKDSLPSEFATNRPDYNKECKPNADACTEDKTTPSGESGGKTTQSAKIDNTTTTSGKQGNKTTPGGKQGSSGKPDDRLKVVGGPGDDSGNSADGLSVGPSQRNIGILCVASIAGFFLIDA